MHVKWFFGKVASFMAKSALCVLGLAAVFALTLAMYVFILYVGDGDAVDDVETACLLFSAPVFAGCILTYVLWFIPRVWQAQFFASWTEYRQPLDTGSKPPMTEDERNRANEPMRPPHPLDPSRGETFVVDPRRAFSINQRRDQAPPARANRRQPDGSTDCAFASDDYNEWFH